jgi:hypothetical protein
MKKFERTEEPLGLDIGMTREQIIARLESIRGHNRFADMAFHAYRDLARIPHEPFIVAAFERNPVCIKATRGMKIDEVESVVRAMPDESIYDEAARLAQPDEVWNYGRGDGLEKALLMATVIRSRQSGDGLRMDLADDRVVLKSSGRDYPFKTGKRIGARVWELA